MTKFVHISRRHYNKLDKLIKKVLPDDLYEFEYDIRGNVSMVKNNITQINFEYDHLESGDVVTVAGTFGVGARTDLPSMDLEYEYDNHGNRTALIDGDEVTSYEFDIGDRLRKITNHKNEIFTFDYDSKNRLKLITRPGSETTYNFFNNDILSQILHKSGSTTISNFEYVINNIGNITQKRTPAGNFDYGYDGNNQLTSATNPETIIDEIYQYDSLGNRTQDQNGNYTYDQTGQKLQEDYKNFYYYSDDGNLTSIVEKGTNKTKNYIYNSENRLIQFKEFDEGANLIRQGSYAYDALGRRIEKVVIDLQVPANNKTRRYVYDGEDILKVFDENNQVISKYTHSTLRIDDALAIDDKVNNKSYYFLKDHLGSIVDIVNEDNTFKQHYAYSSFGELQKVTDVGGNDVTANSTLEHHFTYTGREYDFESGLYHYRARSYDASIGRFLQVDKDNGDTANPISFLTKYSYVSNNPMSLVDPSGNSGEALEYGAYVYIGASLGFGNKGVPIADYGNWCGWKVAPAEEGKNPPPKNNLDAQCKKHDLELIETAERDSVWEEGYGNPITGLYVAGFDYGIYHVSRSFVDFRLGFNMMNHRNWKGKPLQNPKLFVRSLGMAGLFVSKGIGQYYNPTDIIFNLASWSMSKNGKKFSQGVIDFYRKLF